MQDYSAAGICGTLTTYSINDQGYDIITVRVVEFRAKTDCTNQQTDMTQWSLYKLTGHDKQVGPGCTVDRLH